MPQVRHLLVLAALVEVGTGVGALVVPGTLISLLLGTASDGSSQMVGRVLGLALVCLGICCWSARSDDASTSRAGVVAAITTYNAGAAALLATFAATGTATGPVVWVAVALHTGITVALLSARARVR